MAKWESTPAGYINMDELDNVEAYPLIGELIEITRAAIKAGGFSQDDVLYMIKAWEKIGEKLNTATYHQNARAYWVAHGPANDSPKKPSQRVLETLQRLQYETNDADAESHAIAFREAEKAMLVFVYEYRMALQRSDKDAWLAFHGKVQLYGQMRRI